MTTCPDGHPSEASDYCDVCGIAMSGPATSTAASASTGATARLAPSTAALPAEAVGRCPNCGTGRVADDAFCEVCGLDYATGALPGLPTVPTTPAAAPDPAPDGPADPPAGAPSGWRVVVRADRAWWETQEALGGGLTFPASSTRLEVALHGTSVAVGRRSERDGWFPAVDLGHLHDDPGVSRVHGELVATEDAWTYVDTSSTNGSTVDGTPATAGEPVPLHDGSTIHLGAWTRLRLERLDLAPDPDTDPRTATGGTDGATS